MAKSPPSKRRKKPPIAAFLTVAQNLGLKIASLGMVAPTSDAAYKYIMIS